MKRILFFFILVISSLQVFCQNYDPLVNHEKQWSMINCNLAGGFFPSGCTTIFTKFEGDTVLNSQEYLHAWETDDSLQQNWVLKGFIREDIESKQVFYRNLNGYEGLIYDFSLQLYDTVPIFNPYFGDANYVDPFICYKIDTILVNNISTKRFYLGYWYQNENEYHFCETWIEGIGCERGVMYSGGSQLIGGIWDALCCKLNDEVIYYSPLNMCEFYGDDLGPKFTTNQIDTAFVGIPYEFQLEITPNNFDSVWFYEYILPDNFHIDRQTGIITGIPLNTGYEIISIPLMNWNFMTDWESFDLIIVQPVGIQSIETEKVFSVIQNPAFKTVEFTFGNLINDQNIQLQCYNLTGNLLHSEAVVPGQKKAVLNISSWPSGMYVAIVYSNGGVVGKSKFVVE